MAAFLYAFEVRGAQARVPRERLIAAGLGKIFDDKSRPCNRHCSRGPDGANVVIVAAAPAKEVHCDKDKQRWTKSLSDKGGGYWIGYWLDSKPTAAELARDEQIDGHRITLSDGSDWLVPMARCFPTGTKLPETLILTKEGLASRPIARYAEFSRRAARMWNSILFQIGVFEGEPDEIIDAHDEWQLAAEALGLNYYVGADEINALELLTTANLADIVMAVVDMPTYRKWLAEQVDEKKKPRKVLSK